MMSNNTLILTTTRDIGNTNEFIFNVDKEDTVMSYGNPTEEDKSIFRLKGELIFARPLIVKRGTRPWPDIQQELKNFAIQVNKVLIDEKEKDINNILFFIHRDELEAQKDYQEFDISQKPELEILCKEFKKHIFKCAKNPKINIIAFSHGTKHYWGKFLSNTLVKKENISWSTHLLECYEKKKEFEIIKELGKDIEKIININQASVKKFNEKIQKEHPIEGSLFQIIKASTYTFLDNIYLNELSKAIKDENSNGFIPTIIISDKDIMSNEKEWVEVFSLDKRYRFFDSSIWVRYVCHEKNGLGETLEKQLKRVIAEINKHIENKIYESNVAKEYIEYSLRLFENAYLKAPGGGGHAPSIVPFVFHSETYMEQKANKLLVEFEKKNIKWDLLLVDDFAESGLTIGDRQTDKSSSTKEIKKAIIKKILSKKDTEEQLFTIVSATSIEEALRKLKKEGAENKHYDVILLDYLFSKGKGKEVVYGTDLLDKIDNDSQLKAGKSFNYKYWIYPVSVFSDAFHSSLREKGVQYLEKDWVLGRGADPINTPHFFRYDFFDFINLQAKNITYTVEDIIDLWSSHPIKINEDEKKAPIDARSWARAFYHVLWTRFGKSESISYETNFARSARAFRNREEKNSKSYQVFQLLDSILHNLAFSSIFDFSGTIRSYEKLCNLLEKEVEKFDKEGEVLDKKRKKGLIEQIDWLGESIYAIHSD